MRCARFEVAVHEYDRGTLSPEEHRAVEAHAATCPACAELRRVCAETCCRDFVDELPQFLDDELAPDARRRFDRHLSVCADCRAYLDSYRAALSLTAAAFHAAEPEPLPEGLVRSILAARRRPPG